MNNEQLEKYLRNRILVEIKANSLRKRLTEEQIGEIAIYLASDDNLLTEGFFSTIGALLGGSMTETKRFLAKRVVSFLGIPSGHPLSQPVTDFIARLPTKDIYAMYRGNPRMRKKLVSVLSDATVNAFKQEMPNIMALKGGSLGGPITDAMTDVVSTKEFKQSVQKSLEDALINLPGSDAGDLQSIRQDIEDLKAGVSDIQQSLKKQVSTDTAPVEAPSEMPASTKAKVKRRTAAVPPAEVPAADPTAVEEPTAAEEPAVEEPAADDPTAAEEPATELTTEQKLKEIQDFVKQFTPGNVLSVEKIPGQSVPRINFIKGFRRHQDGENKGKVKNWEEVNKIYQAFEKAGSDEEKIEALSKAGFIKPAGYEAIQANRGGEPASDLEDAKATGDAEEVAGAAAATVADDGVDSETKESAKQDLEAAIENAPQEEEPAPPEEDVSSVQDLDTKAAETEAAEDAPIEEPAEEAPEPEVVEEPAVEQPAEETSEPEAVERPEAEVVPEPADDAVDDGVPGEIPQEVRKKYDSLVARYNNPNISNEESTALEAEIEELENAYPGIDDEPEVVAEPALEPESEPEPEPEPEPEAVIEPEPEPKAEEEPASELDADASVERTEAEAAEEAAEEARRKAEKERREAEKAQARAKEAEEAEKKREREKNAEAFRARKEKEQAAAEEEESAAKTYRQVNVELYDDKTIVLSDRSARGKIKRPTLGEAAERGTVSGSSEFSAHAGFGGKKFSRTGVSMVELPPISTDIVAKTNWTQDRKLKGPLTGVIKGFLRDSSDEAAKQFDVENLVIMPATTESGQQISGVIDHRKSKEIDFDYDYTSSNGISGKRIEKMFKDIVSNVVFDGQVDEQRLRRYAKRVVKSAFGRQPFIALIEYLADKELSTQKGGVPDDEDLAIDKISGIMTMDYIRTFIKDLGMAQVREKDTAQVVADMEDDVEAEIEKQAKKKSKKVDEEVRIEEAFDITEEQLRRLLS